MRPRSRQERRQHWFFSRWFLLTLAVLFLLISASLVKELMRSYQIKQEIQALEQEITELEVKTNDFSRFVEFLKTENSFEEQARLKLGLKKPGEKMIVITDEPPNTEPGLFEEPSYSYKQEEGASNPVLWWRYFFQS